MVGMYPIVVSCRVSCTTTLRNILHATITTVANHPGDRVDISDILVTRATARRKIHPRYCDSHSSFHPSACVNPRKVGKVGKHATEYIWLTLVKARMMGDETTGCF